MPIFDYVAVGKEGKRVKGSIDSDSLRAARQKLRSQGIFPTEITEAAEKEKKEQQDVLKVVFRRNRVALAELAVGTRQLATLINAGLPLVEALQALGDQIERPEVKRIFVDIREQVEQGSSLAQALARHPTSFQRLYVNMVAAGEASGTLDTVLSKLADYLDGQRELRRLISSAMMYPILMLLVCAGLVVALLTFVVPRIVEIFERQGASLPLPTQIMIGLSEFLTLYWWFVLLLMVGVTYGAATFYRHPRGRDFCDRALLTLPIIKPIYIKVATARVARTLSALLHSGVSLLTALEITRNIIGNVHLVRVLDDAKEGVREGRSLGRELQKRHLFPALLGQMVVIGERSGAIEEMFSRAADAYEADVRASLEGLTSLLEPLLMLIVGAIVFAIVISVLLPMTDLIELIQQ